MKIRNGFVTNSSSSSFILGFKSKETIGEELLNDVGAKGHVEQIYRDCISAERCGEYEDIREEIEWEEEDILDWELLRSCSYKELCEFHKSEEYKQMIKNRLDSVKKDAEGKNYFVSVSYEGEMEYRVVPYLDCTIRRYDHH